MCSLRFNFIFSLIFFISCQHSNSPVNKHKIKKIEIQKIANATDILRKKEVPILCYHQIRDFKSTDSKRSRDYIVPPKHFLAQMKILHDSGFVTILPDQLIGYLKYGYNIPEKSVMITFDDTDDDQFDVAKPVLDSYGFKAAFFIMTVSINKKGYMSARQIKQLADEGHVIGSHTWDHKNITKMSKDDWILEMDKPKFYLEEIIGKKVKYFAYPFGIWNSSVFDGIKNRKIDAAFQLSARRDESEPLLTIRRIIIPGEWDANLMFRVMKNSFH